MSEGYESPEVAFLYSDGRFYFGRNHVELMHEADLVDEWGSATRWHEPHNLAMGWIWNDKDGTQTAEFYSDNYEDAQDSGLFETVFHELKKKFPKLHELSFGPDKGVWDEMNQEPDWMEKYLPQKQAGALSPEQIVREITYYANTGERPDEETLQKMTDDSHKVRYVDPERMRIELDDLLASERPAEALRLADECGLLDYMIPELGAAYDFNQNNPHHRLTVGDHSLSVLEHVARINKDPDVRLAAMMHDVGKPDAYWEDPFGNGHFYAKPGDTNSQNHEDRGADLARQFMYRLNYDPERVDKVDNLIRNHMWNFYSTPAGARRFVNRAGGPEAASDLLDLKEGDIRGKGTPDVEEPLSQLEMSRALYDRHTEGGNNGNS